MLQANMTQTFLPKMVNILTFRRCICYHMRKWYFQFVHKIMYLLGNICEYLIVQEY